MVDDSPLKRALSACPAALLAARKGGSEKDRYVTPSALERTAFRTLVATLLTPGLDREQAAVRARSLGYRLIEVPEMRKALLLAELPTHRRGGGAYLFRLDSRSTTLVQAPHTFFDEGTLPLSCDLFQRAKAAALFIDTAHRFKAAEVDEHGAYPADVAHAADSLYQAATEGALQALSPVTVVQLHGFGPRESGAAVVLSAGTSQPDSRLPTRARERLAPLVAGPVVRFPDECQELGATSNVQGAIVRAAGGRFLHIEMSAVLRQSLLSDPALRGRYFDALATCLELP